MSEINLNNSGEFIKDLSIFNDGVAGVVENVAVRIEKKAMADADDKKPMYKVIAKDDKGEVNEGYYYQEADSKAFNKYQAQRLINLARGVFGEDVKFEKFSTPKEALDGVMKMVAPALANKGFRVAVTYGTTKRKESFLGFKNFGSFIQPMSVPNTLALDSVDNTIRAPKKEATPASDLIADMAKTKSGNPANLDWLNS